MKVFEIIIGEFKFTPIGVPINDDLDTIMKQFQVECP